MSIMLAVSVAAAEPSPSSVATAKSLVVEGRQLRAQGKHETARDRFRAAWALVPTPIIGLDLAQEYVACGQFVEARELALEVTKLPEGSKESAEGKAARVEAGKLAGELKGRIAALTVRIEGVPAGRADRVTIDGEVVPLAAISVPRRINPGTHVVAVTAGGVTQTKQVVLTEGASESVTIVFGGATASKSEPGPDGSTPAAGPATRPIWPWVAVGAGAIGVIGGGVFALLAAGKNSAIDRTCAPDCGGDSARAQEVTALRSTRDSYWLGAGVLGGAGLAAGLIGLWGLTRDPPQTAGVQLIVGVRSAALRIVF